MDFDAGKWKHKYSLSWGYQKKEEKTEQTNKQKNQVQVREKMYNASTEYSQTVPRQKSNMGMALVYLI